ncbi:MAG: hypothetical protein WD049_09450, partial [Candidatus Paceibacterota bacterium]
KPWLSPKRLIQSGAVQLSGRYPHQSGIYSNYLQNQKIGEDTMHIDPADSIANHFKDAGYMTYASGKFWEGDTREQGFTHGPVDISFRGFLQFVRNGQDELFGFIDDFAGNTPAGRSVRARRSRR